ncbi:glutamate receptor 2 [Schistocerca nitens]|uniref:glutamate receptor 2 n=1 Tax=Schistocerca nitens TaxID=7011 RepID=UPI0021182CD8|nr:glutamate receptor 2 [Schistocerca nitens]
MALTARRAADGRWPPPGACILLRTEAQPGAAVGGGGPCLRPERPPPRLLVLLLLAPQGAAATQRGHASNFLAGLHHHVAARTTVVTFAGWQASAWSWQPFGPGRRCGRGSGQPPQLVASWSLGSAGRLQVPRLFPDHTAGGLRGCALVAATYNIPPYVSVTSLDANTTELRGTEVQLVELAAQSLDARLETQLVSTAWDEGPPWGEPQPGGRWSGVVGRLLDGSADVAFGGLRFSQRRARITDATAPHARDALVWFVPRPRREPGWKTVVVVLPCSVWSSVAGSYLLASLSLWLLAWRRRWRMRDLSTFRSPCGSLLSALLVLLGFSVPRKPTNLVMRLVFLAWVLYSYQVNSIYQSGLISSLVHPGFEGVVSTEEELAQSGLSLATLPAVALVYSRVVGTAGPPVSINCSSLRACVERMVARADVAVLADRAYPQHLARTRYRDQRRRPLFTPLHTETVSYDVAVQLERGSPLLGALSAAVLRVVQAALVRPSELVAGEEPLAQQEAGPAALRSQLVVLSPQHLQGAAALLLAGCVAAAAALAAELLLARLLRGARGDGVGRRRRRARPNTHLTSLHGVARQGIALVADPGQAKARGAGLA